MKKGIKIQITHIHKRDGFYKHRDRYIGLIGMFELDTPQSELGYYGGQFFADDTNAPAYFLAIRYKKIKEVKSA